MRAIEQRLDADSDRFSLPSNKKKKGISKTQMRLCFMRLSALRGFLFFFKKVVIKRGQFLRALVFQLLLTHSTKRR